jgi:1-aminocyclopropane-1-carboxylate deaminase
MTPLQQVDWPTATATGVRLLVKRDDLIHPTVQGNKWRKLKPLFEQPLNGIITFGGAYSNHLHAVALAGQAIGFSTVGLVRGTAVNVNNATLLAAAAAGMILHPIPKSVYDRGFSATEVQDLVAQYPGFIYLPEGGATPQALHSCRAIGTEIRDQLSPWPGQVFVAIPAGTGCTAAGTVAGLGGMAHTLVFPAAQFEVGQSLLDTVDQTHFSLVDKFMFGGFARHVPELIDFAKRFYQQTGILPDPIYTTKMLYGLDQLLQQGFFPNGSTVVAVHTGGLQGWAGFRERFGVTFESKTT